MAALLLILLTAGTFVPVRSFDFVHYDDYEFVVENPHVSTGLSGTNLRWAVANPYWGTGGPLTWLSHMLDVELFGGHAGGHHVTSVTIHTLTALLLLLALHVATGSVWRSLAVASLFAVHPLHVESVAWVAARKDVLSGAFWFAAMIAYVWYAQRPGPARYLTVALLLVLGLLSKPMVATLPFVFLLMDVWPLDRRQGRGRLILEKLPLILLAAGAILWALIEQTASGAVSPLEAIPFEARVQNAIISYPAYLAKMVWPTGLIPYYPFPVAISQAAFWGSLLVVLALTAGAVALIRKRRYLAFGWFWYLGTLVPTLGLVQLGGHAMADRFTYLPLTGIFLAIVWASGDLVRRFPRLRLLVVACWIGVVALCTVATRSQIEPWRDGIALWEHTVNVDPDNARAFANLGAAYQDRGRIGDAIEAYRRALHLEPNVPQAHHNLGIALEAAGRVEQAMHHYAEAVRLRPDYTKARGALAFLLATSGRTADAIPHFDHLLRLEPDNVLAHVNLAIALGQQRRTGEALRHMLQAVQLQPDEAQWRYLSAVLLLEQGFQPEAIAFLERALALEPGHAEAASLLREVRGG